MKKLFFVLCLCMTTFISCSSNNVSSSNLASYNNNAIERFYLSLDQEYTYYLDYEGEGYNGKKVYIEDLDFAYNSYTSLLTEAEQNGKITPACECYSINMFRLTVLKNNKRYLWVEFYDTFGKDYREIYFWNEDDRTTQLHNEINVNNQQYLDLFQYYMSNVQ